MVGFHVPLVGLHVSLFIGFVSFHVVVLHVCLLVGFVGFHVL